MPVNYELSKLNIKSKCKQENSKCIVQVSASFFFLQKLSLSVIKTESCKQRENLNVSKNFMLFFICVIMIVIE